MKHPVIKSLTVASLLAVIPAAAELRRENSTDEDSSTEPAESAAEDNHQLTLDASIAENIDTLNTPLETELNIDEKNANHKLCEKDYEEVAERLGVEVAAIKAVVEIETGQTHEGFADDGKPLINFDLSVYRKTAPKFGVNLQQAQTDFPEVFSRSNTSKYGTLQNARYARLQQAMEINQEAALESTFWGMFQIGGFNWKLCGADSVQDFVKRMSLSEREQLELFATYCVNRNLVKYIQNKNWAAFAYRYNGSGYKKYSYDTRMARAYAKFSK